MSNTIDQRIVEMQFDNSRFEKNVSTSMKTLDNLKKKLNLDDSTRSFNELEKASKRFSLANIANGVESISSKFSALGILGVTAMQRISNAAITAGKNLVSALTIDPIKMGLSEYETQINAIQTILSNTRSKGTTIDDVNNALDELNSYADKTIYNFTEMTRNIGTFTAAGVGLETSTAAIKGIANLAAVSGSTSQQASTAMYQLSQALSSGMVRLMDWNSVVNAGMGGQVFQDALKDTARVHGIAIDKIIEDAGSFRESLQKEWLSSEIMLETLQKFTGDLSESEILAMGYTKEQAKAILELGKDANNAATKVKTFTQLIDTLKEAMQSGWTQSWEYIIGNFEEARELWTGVSDAIGNVINQSAEARNNLLKGWYEAGGRDDLIQGLTDAFTGLWGIVLAVKDAMNDIFPETTVDQLLVLTGKVKDFGASLRRSLHWIELVKSRNSEGKVVTESLGEEGKFGGDMSYGARNDEVKKMQQRLMELGYDLGKTGADGIWGPKTEAALKEFQNKTGETIDGIYDEATHKNLLGALGFDENGDKWGVERVSEKFVVFGEALDKIKRISKGVFAALHIGWQGISALGSAAGKVLKVFAPLGSAILDIAAAFGDWMVGWDTSLAESGKFDEWLATLDEALVPLSEKINTASKALLQFFGIGEGFGDANSDALTFKKIWESITNFFSGGEEGIDEDAITKPASVFERVINTIKTTFDAFKKWVPTAFNGAGLIGSVAAIIGVALFANIVSAVNQFKKIGKNINNLIKSVKDVVSGFGKKKTFTGDFATNILKIAGAIAVLAAVVYMFSKMEWKSIGKGLLGLVAVMAVLVLGVAALKAASKGFKNIGAAMVSLISLAAAIGILTAVVFVLGQMNVPTLVKGIASLGVVLLTLAGFMYLAGKAGKIKSTFGVVLIAAAVLILVKAIKDLSSIDGKALTKGIASLGAVLLELALFAFIAGKVGGGIGTGVEIIALAGSLGPIIDALKSLGEIDKNTLIKGIASLGAVLLELALFAFIVGKAGKLSIGTALTLLSVAATMAVFALIVKKLSGIDTNGLIKGIAALGAVMLEFAGFMAILKFCKPSVKSMLALIPAALALDSLMLVFALVLNSVKNVDAGTIAKALIAMGVVALEFAGFMALVGMIKINISSMLALIPAALAFAAMTLAFSYALNKVKDIDLSAMIGFAASFAITLAAVIAALFVVGSFAAPIGIGAAVIGLIVAVTGAIIAILGAIDEHCGGEILSAMQRGGEIMQAFGEAVGKFIGGIGGGILEAMAASAGEALTTFGDSVNTFQTSISGISESGTLSEDVNTVITIATTMAGFFDSLGGITLNITGLTLFNSGTETLAADMSVFSTAISTVRTELSGIGEDFPDQVVSAISAATTMQSFFDGLPGTSLNIGALSLFNTGMETLATDMDIFGTAISSFATKVAGFSDSTLTEDVDSAVSNASAIAAFLEGIQNIDIETNKSALAKFFTGDNKVNSLFTQMESLGAAITSISVSFSGLKGSDFSGNVELVKTAMTDLASLLAWMSGDENEVETDKWFGLVDSNFTKITEQMTELASKITEFNANTADVDTGRFTSIVSAIGTLVNSLSAISNNIDDDATADFIESIGNIGSALSTALTSGMSEVSADTSGITSVCQACVTTAATYESQFRAIGVNMSLGLGSGIRAGASSAINAAALVARQALAKAKEILDINSPSGEFEDIGMYSDQGWAGGIIKYGKVVTKAIAGVGSNVLTIAKGSFSNLSSILASDINTDPVISPVVDLSNVTTGARMINGILSSNSGVISIGGTTSAKIASAITSETNRRNQNGVDNGNSGINNQNSSTVNVTGNNFNVRSEQDIHSLASEIAALTHQQQLNMGAAY